MEVVLNKEPRVVKDGDRKGEEVGYLPRYMSDDWPWVAFGGQRFTDSEVEPKK